MSLLRGFPAEWRTAVTIVAGGRNADGDPADPGDGTTILDCLIGARATSDPTDRSDVVEDRVTLYGPPRMPIASTSRVTVPAEHFMAGVYEVDGHPNFWPLGTEVALRRV